MERPDYILLNSMRDFKLIEPVYVHDGNMTARQQRHHKATRKKKGRE